MDNNSHDSVHEAATDIEDGEFGRLREYGNSFVAADRSGSERPVSAAITEARQISALRERPASRVASPMLMPRRRW